MSNSTLTLVRTRRLGPLAAANAAGAFNDNLVKAAMVSLALFRLGAGGAGLSALAGALFIAPYALLSATAGQVADRFSKPLVIRMAKVAEIVLMLGAAAAFVAGNVPGMLAVLFGLGIQAALFGPVKYGILPELLSGDELVAGNGAIEASTFLAIVAGTVAGSGMVLLPSGPAMVAGLGMAVTLVGAASAWFIPAVPPADPDLRIDPNVLRETRCVVRHAVEIRAIWLSILGLSWFWTIGATLMTEFPVMVRDTLHANGGVMTLLLAVFAVGVGLGSISCAKLLHGEVSARFVPFAGLGISLFCWDFSRAATHAAGMGLGTVADVATTVGGIRLVADLLLLAMCGGVFSVPLYATMQDRSPPQMRSRMIAANNVLNAVFMVAGAAAAAGLAAAGVDAPGVLQLAAAANIGISLWIFGAYRGRQFDRSAKLTSASPVPRPARTPGSSCPR